jgi:hypothetical protein
MDVDASINASSPTAPVCATGLTLLTGPLLLGFLFAYCLFGVLFTQVYTYWVAFPRDKLGLKVFVWLIFLLELALLVMTTNTAWWFFGSGYGNLSHFTQFDPTSPLQPLIVGILTTLFHLFYAWRMYTLSKNLILPCVISAITATQLGMTMYVAVHGSQTHGHLEAIMGQSFRRVYTVWIVSGIGADTIVTVGMAYILWKIRKFSDTSQTVNRINSLIKYTAETGAIITILAIVDVILYLVERDTFLFFMLYYVQTKLYSNTLMSSLNSRVAFVSVNSTSSRPSAGLDTNREVVLDSTGSTPRSPQLRLSSWRDDYVYDGAELSAMSPTYNKDASPRFSRFPWKIDHSNV